MTETPEMIEEVRKTLGCAEGQSLLERARHFTNPEKFVEVDKLVMAIIKTDKGLATFLGSHTRVDYEVAISRLNHKVSQTFNFMDMEMMKKAQSEAIIKP